MAQLCENQRIAKVSLGCAVERLSYISIFPVPSKLISIRRQSFLGQGCWGCFSLVLFFVHTITNIIYLLSSLCVKFSLSTLRALSHLIFTPTGWAKFSDDRRYTVWFVVRWHSRNIPALFIPGEELWRANCCYFYIDPDEQVRTGCKRNPQRFYCCLNGKSLGTLINVLCGIWITLARWGFFPWCGGKSGEGCLTWLLVNAASYQSSLAPFYRWPSQQVRMYTWLNYPQWTQEK